MTPSAYKMKQGMSAEDALKAVPDTMKTSGEIQTEYLTYGIQSVADDGTVTMNKWINYALQALTSRWLLKQKTLQNTTCWKASEHDSNSIDEWTIY